MEARPPRPLAARTSGTTGGSPSSLDEGYLGRRFLHVEPGAELLFTENETNAERLFGAPNPSPYVKDAFHEYVVHGRKDAVNPRAAARRRRRSTGSTIPAGGSARVRLRLTESPRREGDPLGKEFDATLSLRRAEADEFYAAVIPERSPPRRRASCGRPSPGCSGPSSSTSTTSGAGSAAIRCSRRPAGTRQTGRNSDWRHVFNADVLSMPDTWEFPWYAAWDLAFHCVVLALVDAQFAKDQLVLMLREWYMHPNGQIPAYEWNFGDVNPPVHAWAALRVFQIERNKTGKADRAFLERVFHKLLLNFDWWVNRKDALGNNIFQGGFLGLDNIGIFDRNMRLPEGWVLAQADGTSWMAMYCLNLLGMALELASEDPVYEDVASKFWEHFVYIAYAIQRPDDPELGLWDEHDGFFYDEIHHPDGRQVPIRVRSLVGLLPLTAVVTGDSALVDRFPAFKRRMEWFFEHRPDLTGSCASMTTIGKNERILMSVVRPEQLKRMLGYMLDESEFLSPYGIRSVSRYHREHPYELNARGQSFRLDYEPGESRTHLFGGNSNWRGPIWFPINYLILESLKRFHLYFGDDFRVECPTGSGRMMTLLEVSRELARRLSRIFLPDAAGRRPVFGGYEIFQTDPHWKDLSSSTSTSTATRAPASARAIRPAGPASSRSFSTSSATRRRRCYGADPPLAAGEIRAGVDHARCAAHDSVEELQRQVESQPPRLLVVLGQGEGEVHEVHHRRPSPATAAPSPSKGSLRSCPRASRCRDRGVPRARLRQDALEQVVAVAEGARQTRRPPKTSGHSHARKKDTTPPSEEPITRVLSGPGSVRKSWSMRVFTSPESDAP